MLRDFRQVSAERSFGTGSSTSCPNGSAIVCCRSTLRWQTLGDACKRLLSARFLRSIALLAAMALHHHLRLVTRNTSDFESTASRQLIRGPRAAEAANSCVQVERKLLEGFRSNAHRRSAEPLRGFPGTTSARPSLENYLMRACSARFFQIPNVRAQL